jgi:hypothetical protein
MRNGGLDLTYSFGFHGLDEGRGGGGATVVLEPGAPTENADGRVYGKVSNGFSFRSGCM